MTADTSFQLPVTELRDKIVRKEVSPVELVKLYLDRIEKYDKTLNSYIKLDFNNTIMSILDELYKQKVQSIIIEGGLKTLQSFIEIDMWDEARVFSTAIDLNDGIKSPLISKKHSYTTLIKSDELRYFFND